MTEKEQKVPNSGYLAWLIVLGSFIVNFMQNGFTYSFGLLIDPISHHYSSGRATAALTNSIMFFISQGSGPLAAILVRKLSHRSVNLLGTVLATGGLVGAGFCVQFLPPYIWALYFMVSQFLN